MCAAFCLSGRSSARCQGIPRLIHRASAPALATIAPSFPCSLAIVSFSSFPQFGFLLLAHRGKPICVSIGLQLNLATCICRHPGFHATHATPKSGET